MEMATKKIHQIYFKILLELNRSLLNVFSHLYLIDEKWKLPIQAFIER